ncbi:MAG: hypothetical protein RJA19_173 [Bacteroidota bacterium]|jgi:hypothetical protein
MSMERDDQPIINRVEASDLVTLDLAKRWEVPAFIEVDLAGHLWEGWVLREREFREALRLWDAATYGGKHVALFCSSDAILPDWAWMLTTSRLVALGATVQMGTAEEVKNQWIVDQIRHLNPEEFRDAKLVIKGCSGMGGAQALGALVQQLQPVTASMLYGEPCSTVPIWKRPATR